VPALARIYIQAAIGVPSLARIYIQAAIGVPALARIYIQAAIGVPVLARIYNIHTSSHWCACPGKDIQYTYRQPLVCLSCTVRNRQENSVNIPL
jgi:hypothetical protein